MPFASATFTCGPKLTRLPFEVRVPSPVMVTVTSAVGAWLSTTV
jgi:hypothetical protein